MSSKYHYAELLPPLTTVEFEALKADIKANGMRHPVEVDEDGNVLDGKHRLKIDPDAKVKVIRGLSDAEKRAYVYRCNLARRNLSVEQRNALRKEMKATAFALREQDAKRYTQKVVAATLGVDNTTVSLWFRKDVSNSSARIANPDARIKVAPAAQEKIVDRVAAGEKHEQVAADFGISRPRVTQIVNKIVKQREARKEVERHVASAETTSAIQHGPMLSATDGIADGSVDLIFTDPPYDQDAVECYRDLAKVGSRILRPGGWCLAYSGQHFLPQVLAAMGDHLEYGWTFAIVHKGGDLRFRKFKLQNHWKPIVGFYRPPLKAWWDWFPDTSSGGKEKDAHEWQQAESEAAHFIAALTISGALVCDPYCGSGTTLVAAKRLGRVVVGCDQDKRAVNTARKRLEDTNDGTTKRR